MSITYSDHTVPTFTNDNYSYYTVNVSDIKPNTIYANGTDLTSFFKAYQEKEKKKDIYFKKVIQRNPNRVYEFIFQDNTHIKTICAEEDLKIFNLKYAFFLALAKYLYKDKYTFMGILNKIPDLMQQKKYIKIVKEGMKLFREQQKEKEELEKKEKRNKEIQKNHYLKNQKRKKAQKEKENNILKETIKEAINESK